MDEGLLNDLLECSVCLERLDTSSRVLPCQHTFCLKCLKVIVESHKELRCPECRVLVEAKVEELPPNVLLMRILEGMRSSSTPRKPAGSTLKGPRVGGTHHVPAGSHAAPTGEAKPPPPHARALYDYRSKEIGDLHFKKGDIIFLHKRLDPFWYQGESGGRVGVFPITYVQVVSPLPAPAALCKALYDFRMSAPDEEGCLAFDKGAIITVHRRVDENWAEGRLAERVGIFPLAFVELSPAARHLINSPTLNRAAPPPPDPRHAQHSHRLQQMSISAPTATQTYQNVATMSQSQPSYAPSQPITASQMGVLTRPIDKHSELIHFTNIHNKSNQTVGLQNISRINDNFERLRSAKYEYSAPKTESTYQNVRTHEHFPVSIGSFNAQSSDSSSSNTQSISTTTPNTSDTSTSDEPSLPSSPDAPAETPGPEKGAGGEISSSLGVLSLNESSTATNTALNVTLPPADSPNTKSEERKSDPGRLAPSSSKSQAPGPVLLPFGLGLQAALGPTRRGQRPAPPGASGASLNRHSAEILTTSLLDTAERGERSERSERGERSERRRRRRSRSSERPLPAPYVALYAYRPQKPDELELKKGCVYTVTERCRDGWFKGRSERSQRSGVFPGNYVAAAALTNNAAARADAEKAEAAISKPSPPPPPTAPPRANDAPVAYVWGATGVQQVAAKPDKSKEKPKPCASSPGVSLMRRLAAMKRRSPPPPGYSCDNPVFEDSAITQPRAQHVRSGSCPSQLLGAVGAGGSQRLRAKERPALAHDLHRSSEGAWPAQHRKSQSLDAAAARRERHHSQPLSERFRCIVPYPPNSEYELELKLDDIVVVTRKRGDGWYKGTLQRNGRTGLFPASFVQSCPE